MKFIHACGCRICSLNWLNSDQATFRLILFQPSVRKVVSVKLKESTADVYAISYLLYTFLTWILLKKKDWRYIIKISIQNQQRYIIGSPFKEKEGFMILKVA